MAIRLLLALLGIAQATNGLAMLVAPASWYSVVPGVAMTGPFNPHFVRDIGLIYLASGVGLLFGARKGRDAAVLAVAGAAWPALHGLLHVYEWIAHGFPADPATAVTEGVGVLLAAALGATLAWMRIKGEAKC
jgi:hypothetical protein